MIRQLIVKISYWWATTYLIPFLSKWAGDHVVAKYKARWLEKFYARALKRHPVLFHADGKTVEFLRRSLNFDEVFVDLERTLKMLKSLASDPSVSEGHGDWCVSVSPEDLSLVGYVVKPKGQKHEKPVRLHAVRAARPAQ